MNSSISISEARHWRRLLWRYSMGTLIVGAAVSVLLLALDPYDTGRFSLLPADGVLILANASPSPASPAVQTSTPLSLVTPPSSYSTPRGYRA